jgi:integrase
MRKTLSDKAVAALKPKARRYAFPDPELVGHYVRIQPSGAKSFAAVARDPNGKQVWATIGAADALAVAEARERARQAIQRIRDGLSPFEAPPVAPKSFEAIAEQWLKRHVRAKGLRSEGEVTRLLRTHVYPAWKGRAFADIRRSDVTALLDEVEDDHGARQADYVLAIVRGISNWYARRHDDYVPPIVKGMGRRVPKERERSRILTDDELGFVWRRAEANGTFGALIRLLLLTAQRRDKVVSMQWADIVDGVWTIPGEKREKGNAGKLRLPAPTLEIVEKQPRFANSPYILAGRGNDGPINGFSRAKRAFDAKLPGVARRTARSLMSRAGVRPDIAERVLGHKLQGVEGVYDRHRYFDEKAEALARLATLIDGIVHPRDNVVPMGRRS